VHQVRVERPRFPEGYVAAFKGDTFALDHLRQRMMVARVYWVSTVTRSSRPYARPIWGGWIDDLLYLEGSPENGTFRNLARSPYAVVHLDSQGGDDVAIVEGPIDIVEEMDPAIFARLAEQMAAKYTAFNYRPETGTGMRRLTPRKALAWLTMETATRWVWE